MNKMDVTRMCSHDEQDGCERLPEEIFFARRKTPLALVSEVRDDVDVVVAERPLKPFLQHLPSTTRTERHGRYRQRWLMPSAALAIPGEPPTQSVAER